MENMSLVLHGPRDLRVSETQGPKELGPNDVLLKTHYVGICGTDIHFWSTGRMGPFQLTEPHILGHEASATIVEVGSAVTRVKSGDRVTIEPAIPCFECDFCRDGENNLCHEADQRAVGSPPQPGCLQTYFMHPSQLCHKLPENMSLEEGALVEPLACVVHGIRRAGITVGQKVLICGAGPMGLLSMLTAKAYGAAVTCVTDINPSRLSHAKSLGAEHTFLVTLNSDPVKSAKQVKYLMGSQPDVTLECSGAESSTRMAIYATRRGGKVVLVGLGPPNVSVPLVIASLTQVDIIGSARYCNTFPAAIDLIASGKVNAKDVVTHKFTLQEAASAFETMSRGEGSKVLIEC